MSVSSIFAPSTSLVSSSTNLLQQLESAASSSGSSATGADSTDLSQAGQLFSQLQSLATSNPSEFKQVTAAISQQLTQAASQQTGSAATALTNLAKKFQEASQTGSAAGLAPTKHHGGHHHGGGGGGLSALLSSASSTTQAATSAYSSQSQTQDPFDQVLSIIQNALSGSGSSSTTTAG